MRSLAAASVLCSAIVALLLALPAEAAEIVTRFGSPRVPRVYDGAAVPSGSAGAR